MKNMPEISSCPSNTNTQYSRQILLALLLAFIMLPTAMATGVYKWTDENGKVHYGSQRPENAEAETLNINDSQPTPAPKKSEGADEANLPVDDKAKQERLAYCKKERNRLKTVEKNKTIHEKDASGNVVKLAAKERQQRLSKIQANINKYCK